MKKSILNVKYAVMVLLFVATISCSKEDPAPTVSIPIVSYASPTMEATFFKVGHSTAPTVSWNNNQGLFSLTTAIEGLSINASTGVLNWTKTLPQGEHAVEVIAKNSAGQTSISLTLKNALQGQFIGSHKWNDKAGIFKIKFIADGSIEVIAGDNDANLATGTWLVAGDVVTSDYTYPSRAEFSLKGTLTQTASEVTLIGYWYNKHGAITEKIGESFSVVLK